MNLFIISMEYDDGNMAEQTTETPSAPLEDRGWTIASGVFSN